jgi:2,4-dienoyl-CoA reductase-like NADH-dependent reductase (Old Yellow Enzyme family)
MLGARLSVKEWVDGGFDVDEAIEVARALKAEGVAYICCSSGGNSPLQKLPTGPGYQVHLAQAIRKGADIPTRAVGLIADPQFASTIISEGRADMVALARAFLADPRWGWRAAATFGEEIHPAPQLARSVTTMQHWMKASG